MRTKGQKQVEDLLPGYFSDEIGKNDRVIVDNWKKASDENFKQFKAFQNVWETGEILALMKHFKADEALQKVEKRIGKARKIAVIGIFQKIAAILLIPLLIYSGYTFLKSKKHKNSWSIEQPIWNEVKTTTGMQSNYTLPDGSEVWLNSSTSLKYPLGYGEYREVELTGEAFFDVKKDEKHPFIVKMGKINIEVVGTSFNILNYPDEKRTEIILKTGKVELFTGEYSDKKGIVTLNPGQKALYDKIQNKLFIDEVEVVKYTAWMEGKLMFIDDPMDEVVRKLNRWFNVDIVLKDESLYEYIYKATFEDETLDQILELLKLSAPIEYKSETRRLLPDGTFTKRKITIEKRNI